MGKRKRSETAPLPYMEQEHCSLQKLDEAYFQIAQPAVDELDVSYRQQPESGVVKAVQWLSEWSNDHRQQSCLAYAATAFLQQKNINITSVLGGPLNVAELHDSNRGLESRSNELRQARAVERIESRLRCKLDEIFDKWTPVKITTLPHGVLHQIERFINIYSDHPGAEIRETLNKALNELSNGTERLKRQGFEPKGVKPTEGKLKVLLKTFTHPTSVLQQQPLPLEDQEQGTNPSEGAYTPKDGVVLSAFTSPSGTPDHGKVPAELDPLASTVQYDNEVLAPETLDPVSPQDDGLLELDDSMRTPYDNNNAIEIDISTPMSNHEQLLELDTSQLILHREEMLPELDISDHKYQVPVLGIPVVTKPDRASTPHKTATHTGRSENEAPLDAFQPDSTNNANWKPQSERGPDKDGSTPEERLSILRQERLNSVSQGNSLNKPTKSSPQRKRRISMKQKTDWLSLAGKARFDQRRKSLLAKWGVKERYTSTCVLWPRDWQSLTPLQIMDHFNNDKCPTGNESRLSYEYSNVQKPFSRATAWFQDDQWPRNDADFDNFMQNCLPIIATHLCNQNHCLIHITYESSDTHHDRQGCFDLARKLRLQGRPRPSGCDKHDPPCLMQHASLTILELCLIQFSVFRQQAKKTALATKPIIKPCSHPYQTFETQTPLSQDFDALTVDSTQLISIPSQISTLGQRTISGHICPLCTTRIRSFATESGFCAHLRLSHSDRRSIQCLDQHTNENTPSALQYG